MTLILASYLQPWVASLLVAGVLVIIVTLCACQGEKDTRYQDFGIPGKLSSIAIDTVPQSTIEHSNGRPESIITNGSAGSDGKARTVTERALPDIPRAVQQPSFDTDTDQTPDSGSECYATVTKRGELENGSANGNSEQEPNTTSQAQSPANASPLHRDGACSPNSDVSTFTDHALALQEPSGSHTYAQVLKSNRHPYARLSAPGDTETSNDHYHGSPDEVEQALFLAEDANLHGVVVESPDSPVSFIAGQAVAGNIPSAEIPYMTPPLTTPTQPENPQLAVEKEIPYTVISVREPLDRVRMQTQQHMRRRQHSNQGSSLDEPEGYYMEVPEDEQTYAEIDSGQNSGESSSNYDLIEPRGNTDFPPDPPTVESLKSVAKAHSRQASIASVSSFGSGVAGENNSKDGATVYSMMDKSKKQNSGAATSSHVDPVTINPALNVEDLYAKVHKKRVEGTLSVSGIEEVLRMDSQVENGDDVFASARTSWSSSATQPHLPPVLPPNNDKFLRVNKSLGRRHSAEPAYSESSSQPWPEEEPGYAAVRDKVNGKDPDYDHIEREEPSYAQVKRTHEDSDVVEPGYELIGRTPKGSEVEPGYEQIQRHHSDVEQEPGYELIRRQNFKEVFDPGYECVRNLDQSSSDPGYERVPMIMRSGSDVVDPGYESVRRVKRETDRSDPDYECIPFARLASDADFADPGYERVKKLDNAESDSAGDPGYERVGSAKPTLDNHVDSGFHFDGSPASNGNAQSPSSESGDSVFNADNPVYEPSHSEHPPSYNDSFICDKISLNVPYSDSVAVTHDNSITVRVKHSSDSESSVSYSASIVEVECGSKSTRPTSPNELNGLLDSTYN